MKILSKVTLKVLLITLLAVSLAAVAGAEDIKLGIGTVNVSSLHLRSKPNTESVVLNSAQRSLSSSSPVLTGTRSFTTRPPAICTPIIWTTTR